MFDTDETFSDVNVGDYLIIDPAGDLVGPSGVPSTGLERGSRPFGDRSVPDRDTAVGGDDIVSHCNDCDRMSSIAESVGIEGGGLVGIRVGDTKTIDVNLIGCRLKVVAGFGGKGEVDDA